MDSVERLVLPIDAGAAFELLATVFQADDVAMENCGEHHWDVACAYKRAAGVTTRAAARVISCRFRKGEFRGVHETIGF